MKSSNIQISESKESFGKGIAIIDSQGNSYEQYSVGNGLTARIFQGPQLLIGPYKPLSLERVEAQFYTGFIFKNSISEKDYDIFRQTTDNLLRITRRNKNRFDNSEDAFSRYIHTEDRVLLKKHPLPGIDILYKPWDFYFHNNHDKEMSGRYFPDKAQALINSQETPEAVKYMEKRLESPNYLINRFIAEHTKLKIQEILETEEEKASEKVITQYDLIKEMFPYTRLQKGYSITYRNEDRESVVKFLDFAINGGEIPQLEFREYDRHTLAA